MAGDWIKMRCELGHDPDVIQMAANLNMDEFAVVGRLHAVWSWLDQHSETGTNVRITTAYLDRLTACPGFAEAMRTVGWLSGRDSNLTFPGYETHNGETAKHRASETKRKQKQRNKCPAKVGTNVPEKPGPEKRREEKNSTPVGPVGEIIDIQAIKPLCTIQQARSQAPMARLTEDEAEHWWHTRNASGWTKASANGGPPRRITSWQSDMATSAPWVREQCAAASTSAPQEKQRVFID